MSTDWVMFVEVRSLLTSVKRLLMTTFRLLLIFHTSIFFWGIMVGQSEMVNVISKPNLILNFISEEQKLKSWNLKIYTNICYHSVTMGQDWYSLIHIFASIKQMNCQPGVSMCGTHPYFKNMGSGGFRVPGRNPKSGSQWVPGSNQNFFCADPCCQRELIKFQVVNILWKFRRKFYLLSECSFRCRRVQN